MIRGCTAANLTVEVSENGAGVSTERRFAAVNSTFAPPLPSLRTAVEPPQCSVVVAGESVCDARSRCQPRQSGGVECACVGDGLRDSSGTEPDGRLCTQATGIDMLALTRTVVVDLQKPGNHSEMRIVVEAKGERTVPLQYHATMTRSDTVEQQSGTWARNWSRLDEQQLSVHGHHLIWAAPPSTASGGIPLNAEAQKFSGSTDLSFKLRLDCHGAQACVKDGDTVETVIAVGSPGSALGPSNLEPEVRILAHVQSLLSCRHTRALIEAPSRFTSTRIRVRVFANDVDNLPVAFTRAEIHLVLSDNSIPLQWSRGSNEYTADVPTELFQNGTRAISGDDTRR